MNSSIIPVMHCFDNNYVIPAAVAFFSMLEHANKNYHYKLYVLHTDITVKNQEKLKQTIKPFENAELIFIDMMNKFDDLFKNIKSKAHYSKEMFYKFLAPSIFKKYDKIMITDVDVVFLGDIAENFTNFNVEDDFYLAGHKTPELKGSWLESYQKNYKKYFSTREINMLKTCAGYWIFNLKKMREDDIEKKCIDFSFNNSDRIIQPEQDTVNIVCHPKIKMLKMNAVVCTYVYDLYKTEIDLNNDMIYSADEIKYAMENPIQLHYATHIKPWKYPASTKSEIWFAYLLKTPFVHEQMTKFITANNFEIQKQKIKLFKFIPFLKKKKNKMSNFYNNQELQNLGLKRFGDNVLISKKCSIYGANDISIGNNVRIDDFCILSGKITIGNYVHISAYSALYGRYGISIGNFCGISPRSTIYSASDDFSGEYMISPMVPEHLTNLKHGQVSMEDFSQLGANSIVMPGARLKQGAVSGAFSLILDNLEEWTINIGIPCKFYKARKKNILDLVQKMKENYETI